MVLPSQQRIPLPCPELPELVLNSITAIQACTWNPCRRSLSLGDMTVCLQGKQPWNIQDCQHDCYAQSFHASECKHWPCLERPCSAQCHILLQNKFDVCIPDAQCNMQAHDSVSMQDESAVWEEQHQISKFAEGLEQLDKGMGRWGRSIPADPAAWACDDTGVTENIWLNLSTGFIGSGRQVIHLHCAAVSVLPAELHRVVQEQSGKAAC